MTTLRDAETSLIDWLATSARDAFYLDGKLYFMTESGLPPAGVRGSANLARYDLDAGGLVLTSARGLETVVPLDATVHAHRDVARWRGNDSRTVSENRLARLARTPQPGIGVYLARRTRFGVVDGWVIEDSHGLITPRRSDGLMTVKAKTSVEVVKLGDGDFSPVAGYVFTPRNSLDPERGAQSFVVTADEAIKFRVVGRNLAYTSQELADELRWLA